jgi:hypothetical protein
MYGVVEHHGRLSRADGRPANPGTYHLRFTFHATPEGLECLWEENLRSVTVSSGGFYHVLLGQEDPISEEIFRDAPAWLAVQVIRAGHAEDATSQRVPLLGSHLMLHRESRRCSDRLDRVETVLKEAGVLRIDGAEAEAEAERLDIIEEALARLATRMADFERNSSTASLEGRLGLLEKRVAEILDLEERVLHVEDELDDIVGPDGDVVDLAERLEQIEETIVAANQAANGEGSQPKLYGRIAELEGRIAALGAMLERSRGN